MPFLNGDGDDATTACGLVRRAPDGFFESAAPVPLAAVDVTVEVTDFVAEVTVRQDYVNKEEK